MPEYLIRKERFKLFFASSFTIVNHLVFFTINTPTHCRGIITLSTTIGANHGNSYVFNNYNIHNYICYISSFYNGSEIPVLRTIKK